MFDFTEELSNFFSDYEKSRVPIDVDFRNIVPITNFDRLTHFLHPYPAKLLQHIPIFFLNNTLLSHSNSLVLDPFNGSGTVALEALCSDRKFIGTDINPFACLLSNVKCTYIEDNVIDEHLQNTLDNMQNKHFFDFNVVNKEKWFEREKFKELSKLIQAINEIEDENVKKFFQICFSSSMRKVSNADPRVSVPVKINPQKYSEGHKLRQRYENILETISLTNVCDLFTTIVGQNKKRLSQIKDLEFKDFKIIEQDAKSTPTQEHQGIVDLIITSPPYPGAQKYIRACALSIGWLELYEDELVGLKHKVIGREEVKASEFTGKSGINQADRLINRIYKINTTRAVIAESYLRDMQLVLKSCYKYLKKDGWLVLVAANNLFCKMEFLTLEYLKELAEKEGFVCHLELVDTIKSYGLMTKRNKSAGIISREGILLLKKYG